ncbi:FIST N-terminal domain-containing protein [Pseudothioclava nitratireducens]|uniref:FIST N-terminal domain-containing protein n=1 Tax=Pseudothioclava nitratireducens TaxID=1928646 RepID=UPI0023DAC9D8|nr:FIST N-terminal domain-containing protein [Defluviimonas nitratireducens]MDF1620601.1 FIST N-terminal domain-containing protein [Defluviimonas nitratireducens]
MTATQTEDRRTAPGGQGPCPRRACAPARADDALDRLVAGLGPGPFALVLIFASPEADLESLTQTAQIAFPRTTICGCTTAGEITDAGYDSGQIVAFAFPQQGFEVEALLIEGIEDLDTRALIADLLRARQSLARRGEGMPNEFALLLVDGLSGQEDALVAALSGGLGPVPMVGGSAGDGNAFRRTLLSFNGKIHENAAVLCLMRGLCEVRTFSLDNTRPTEARMVVTRADPRHRLVARINDEPAAEEYARLLGLMPEQLSPFVFAAHPVLVRAGGRHHVRAIQGVGPENSLIFFAAIDEGLVLTIADPADIADHLEAELSSLSRIQPPSAILGFDCFFRRIEAEGRQKVGQVSQILARHRVAGFSTYGEQIGAMHVNQTMTGVAFYPPEPRR